jgi:hypothetical protein
MTKRFFIACRDNNTRYCDNRRPDLQLDPMAQGAVTVMDLTTLLASLSSALDRLKNTLRLA